MLVVRFAALVLAAVFLAPCFAQESPSLLAQMAGTWNVEQRMWTAPGGDPVGLPAAVAQRRLVRDVYLEEVMQPAADGPEQASKFTRHAFINYNPVTSRYEYSSLDTRAPQLMVEQSQAATPGGQAEIGLLGGSFLAPEWGTAKNVRFKYRLTMSQVKDSKQTVRLFLTPLTVLPKREFLAFEYIYSKRP